MKPVSVEEIIKINKQTDGKGRFNNGRLDEKTIERRQCPSVYKYKYGVEPPSSIHIAANLAKLFVESHPFANGNKRTGLGAFKLFLDGNELSEIYEKKDTNELLNLICSLSPKDTKKCIKQLQEKILQKGFDEESKVIQEELQLCAEKVAKGDSSCSDSESDSGQENESDFAGELSFNFFNEKLTAEQSFNLKVNKTLFNLNKSIELKDSDLNKNDDMPKGQKKRSTSCAISEKESSDEELDLFSGKDCDKDKEILRAFRERKAKESEDKKKENRTSFFKQAKDELKPLMNYFLGFE